MIEGLRCTVLSLKAQYKDALQKKRGQFLKKGTNSANWDMKNTILRVPVPQLSLCYTLRWMTK